MTEQQREKLAKLREPFDASTVEKLPKNINKDRPKEHCNVCGGFHHPASLHLDYVGHARVTERLLDVDPHWTWEPAALMSDGRPLLDIDDKGRPVGLWIRLTVLGVTRLGYGTCEATKAEPVKELIGDALRNAAMRFGVALDLWKKHSDADAAEKSTRGRQATGSGSSSAPRGLASQAQIGKIHATAKERNLAEDVVRRLAYAKWAECEGHLSKLTGGGGGQASEFITFLSESDDEKLDKAVAAVEHVKLPEEPSVDPSEPDGRHAQEPAYA